MRGDEEITEGKRREGEEKEVQSEMRRMKRRK
jgi:hypothetical protein